MGKASFPAFGIWTSARWERRFPFIPLIQAEFDVFWEIFVCKNAY